MTNWVPGIRCGNVAPRWSNPSGSIGIHRFRVWPDDADHYNHIELAQNWDKMDAMIGVAPDGSEWPPTTGLDGGLYAVINDLQGSILPIGMMLAWHRPSLAIPLPQGFAICDGTTLSATEHDFTGGGNVLLPDMRNRFILGADSTKTIGQAGVAITDPNINASAGAPGPSGTGGSNTATFNTSQMAAHNHAGGSKTGWSDLGLHWYTTQGMHETIGGDVDFGPYGASNSTSTGVGGWRFGQHRHLLDSMSAEGNNAVHENRPAYIGLIWIMKVKNIG